MYRVNIGQRIPIRIVMVKHNRFYPRKNLLNPSILLREKLIESKVARTVQREVQFVVLVPRAYHGEFSVGYNILKATSLPTFHDQRQEGWFRKTETLRDHSCKPLCQSI